MHVATINMRAASALLISMASTSTASALRNCKWYVRISFTEMTANYALQPCKYVYEVKRVHVETAWAETWQVGTPGYIGACWLLPTLRSPA